MGVTTAGTIVTVSVTPTLARMGIVATRRLDPDAVASLLRLATGEVPSLALVQVLCERTAGELRPLLRLLWQALGAGDEPARALAVLADAGTSPAPNEGTHAFRREGEYWTLVFEGRTSRVRDRIGLRHIGAMLCRPGVRVPALALTPDVGSTDPERARVRVTKATRSAIARVALLDPACGEHLRATIRLGTHCSYAPTDLDARNWDVRGL